MREHLPRLSLLSKVAAGMGILAALWAAGEIVYALWLTPPPSSKDPGLSSVASLGPKMMAAVQFGVFLVALAMSTLHLIAARHYLSATRHGLLKLTAWLSLVPCSFACIFGVPFGIYALVVLYSDEVKKLFDDVERGKSLADALHPPPSGSGRRAALPNGSGKRPSVIGSGQRPAMPPPAKPKK